MFRYLILVDISTSKYVYSRKAKIYFMLAQFYCLKSVEPQLRKLFF